MLILLCRTSLVLLANRIYNCVNAHLCQVATSHLAFQNGLQVAHQIIIISTTDRELKTMEQQLNQEIVRGSPWPQILV